MSNEIKVTYIVEDQDATTFTDVWFENDEYSSITIAREYLARQKRVWGSLKRFRVVKQTVSREVVDV